MKSIRKLTRAVTLSVAVLTVLTLCVLAVSAVGEDSSAATEAVKEAGNGGLYFLSIALCLLPAACGVVEGLATGKAVESISRNPESAPKVQSLLILGLALTESSSIYGFAVALILIFLK